MHYLVDKLQEEYMKSQKEIFCSTTTANYDQQQDKNLTLLSAVASTKTALPLATPLPNITQSTANLTSYQQG